MKKRILSAVFLVSFSLGFSYAKDKVKHPIVGTWEYVSAKINGNNDARSETMNRTQHFFADQSFEGRFMLNEGEPQLYNNGKYFMASDTTLVTIQYDLGGTLSYFSNVFTVKIKNDTLHQYGFFIRPVSATSIVPVFLEEYWVKKKETSVE